MNFKQTIFLIAFLSLSSVSFAQFNVKVGYAFAYTPAPDNNQLIADFNAANAFRLDREMKDLHFISGLEIGLNYSIENIGFEFSYENLTTDKDALGEEANGDLFRERLYWGLSGYSLAVENIWGRYGYGIAFGRRNHKVQENIANSGEKRPIMEQKVNSTKIYGVFHLGGTNTLSFQIRPFVNIPWNTTDLGLVRQNLELSTTTNSLEKFVTYGISFAFYNGPQS